MAPLTPYMTEELWRLRGHETSVHLESWPVFDPDLAVESVVKLVVQVNGKLRDTIELAKGTDQGDAENAARASDAVNRWISEKDIRKVIFVPDRLINFVV